MSHLLEAGKEESARIRVENIIREELSVELLEILELYCELLLARIGLLEAKECDPGLEEAVKSIIYAAPRTDVRELQQARSLLVEKFGKEFALQAVENSDKKVAERVLEKLKVEPPPQDLVTGYLREIARTYNVDWPKGEPETPQQDGDEDEDDDDDDENPSGGQAIKDLEPPLSTEELSRATPPRDLGPKSPIRVTPPSPSTDNVRPVIKLPGVPDTKPAAKAKGGDKPPPYSEPKSTADNGDMWKSSSKKTVVPGKIPDVDELARRFAALKK
jgi:vacuolar protein sorting-associated protein IST1